MHKIRETLIEIKRSLALGIFRATHLSSCILFDLSTTSSLSITSIRSEPIRSDPSRIGSSRLHINHLLLGHYYYCCSSTSALNSSHLAQLASFDTRLFRCVPLRTKVARSLSSADRRKCARLIPRAERIHGATVLELSLAP